MQEAIGSSGLVQSRSPRLKLEILDLDTCTEEEEVLESIVKATDVDRDACKVKVFAPNKREVRMAVVDLPEADALKLLNTKRLRVGWVNCRVRQRIELQRCYKCMAFGHTRRDCKGADRSGNCWKCGKSGHKAVGCEANPWCTLCAEANSSSADHVLGSGACFVFREALNAKKHNTAE